MYEEWSTSTTDTWSGPGCSPISTTITVSRLWRGQSEKPIPCRKIAFKPLEKNDFAPGCNTRRRL